MFATFDSDHTVKLLEAADGDFARLRAAVEYIRKNQFVWVIEPKHVKAALKKIPASASKAA